VHLHRDALGPRVPELRDREARVHEQGAAGAGPGLRELLGDHDPEGEAGVDGLGADPVGDGHAALGQRGEPGCAREAGFGALPERGVAAADGIDPEAVYAGFSFGVVVAQQLAQTRPGARGALLMESCIPVGEFGEAWPEGVPVQIHGKEGDEFFDEDLPAARQLAASTATAELFLYPGDQHLFADSSLDAYDPEASALLMERVQRFLASA
jgi:pimeloyl-ACP methyl ester carboxylesterase